jgi:hypothetical protein
LMKETAFSHTAFGQTISGEAPAPLAGAGG